MKRQRFVPIIHEKHWKTTAQIDDMKLPGIKRYLKDYCEFDDLDIKMLFQLLSKNLKSCCKAYSIYDFTAGQLNDPDIEVKTSIMLEILAECTKVGPRPEKMFFELSKLSK